VGIVSKCGALRAAPIGASSCHEHDEHHTATGVEVYSA
jgi:hypothetical protein